MPQKISYIVLIQVYLGTAEKYFYKQENYYVQALLENENKKHTSYTFQHTILLSLNLPL